MSYIDLYLLPVPERNIDEYRAQASTFAAVVMEHGALGYREFVGEDLVEGFEAPDGHVLTSAVAEFESREHRDRVMEGVMSDARVKALVEGDQIADMSAMRYGGFSRLVEG